MDTAEGTPDLAYGTGFIYLYTAFEIIVNILQYVSFSLNNHCTLPEY